jgi:hypothetical protein
VRARRPKVNTSRLRSPAQLARDAELDAVGSRTVYTERALEALSSPLEALRSFMTDDRAIRLAEVKLQTQAAKIRECCTSSHPVPVLARIDKGGAVGCTDALIAPHHCGRPLCDRCERRPATHDKSRRRLDAALDGALKRGAHVRFITLTIRNRERLADALGELNRASLELRKSPEWAHHITGGVRALEVTYNDGKRRRLRKDVAAIHGMMTGGGAAGPRGRTFYLEEKRKDRKGNTVTTRRDLTDRDAKEFLDGLHDSGADIYRETPWSERRCGSHGRKGCHACDPRGWHPHHHIVAEGEFWLGLCEVCLEHGRFNCGDCRGVNSKRRAALKSGTTAPDKRWLVRVCGGLRSQDELTELRRRGAQRMERESDEDHRKRLRKHHQAFDWLANVTAVRCRLTKLRQTLANEHRLGADKGWTKRREQTVERLNRQIGAALEDTDDTSAHCLSCSMANVTGGESGVVDVRTVTGWAKALKGGDVAGAVEGVAAELLKYLTKSAVMPAQAMVEFAWVMQRKRRVAWFGTWQGIELEAEEVAALKAGTQFDILWEAIHERGGAVRRLYFKGPAALCEAARRGHPDASVDLWPDPDRPGCMTGSAELTPELAAALYSKAAKLVPEQSKAAAPYSTKREGAAPSRAAPIRAPEQIAVPY